MKKLLWLVLVLVLTACGQEKAENPEMDEFVETMEASFEQDFEVDFDDRDNTYTLVVTSETFAYEILTMMDGQLSLADWDYFTSSLVATTEYLAEGYGEDYTIKVQNPANNKKSMYIVTSGTPVYDFMYEH